MQKRKKKEQEPNPFADFFRDGENAEGTQGKRIDYDSDDEEKEDSYNPELVG